MQKKHVRKVYYIKNSAQSKFIVRFILISILGGLGAVSAFNFLAYRKIDSVLYSMRLPSISPGGLLWNEMMYTNVFVIVFTLLIFAITARGLYIKVNGPLKKMTSDISKAGHGDLRVEITLRDKDEFKEFAQELNLVFASLNGKFLALKEANAKLHALASAANADQDLQKQRIEIEESLTRMENAIGAFTI